MSKAQIGVYGLGTMGSALALNMAENGFEVAVTNRETSWIDDFVTEAADLAGNLHAHDTLEAFVADLATPRVILFMIPSGKPMDMMLDAIIPLLEPGDTVIDGGNADFHLTRARSARLAEHDLHFVGMGVSGGEAGARKGPSMMVGGTPHSWQQLGPILRAIAATFEGDPCVDLMGPDGAGHFVKTVHNGIEYADMQMIAELYGLMRHGAGRTPAQISETFAAWNDGPLKSYLVEITADVLSYADPGTDTPMIDVILDAAGQKGTGRWTVIEAIKLGQSASAIEAAVGGRAWSAEKETRGLVEDALGGDRAAYDPGADDLAEAFLCARALGYAQGFRILRAASEDYDWGLDYARIAEVWRAGCIIRSALLDDISDAFRASPPQGELILAPAFVALLRRTLPALRRVVSGATAAGHAIPALSGALAFADSMRQGRGTAAVIQAQRDRFGYHGFKRLDRDGDHHGPWWD